MASVFRMSVRIYKSFKLNLRQLHSHKSSKFNFNKNVVIGFPGACLATWLIWKQMRKGLVFPSKVYAAKDSSSGAEGKTQQSRTFREELFQQFASIQYEGVVYMTPQDFLESVTENAPRPRIGHTKLSKQDVDDWLKKTPNKRKGSKVLFRSMHNRGLISYTEYLFLLCILTKPQTGFHIAFNMFDTDGNQIVDKKEFLVLEAFFTLPPHERKFVSREQKHLQAILDLEGVFSKQSKLESTHTDTDTERNKSVQPIQDTTLLVHFFGPRGNDVLKYDDFYKFMENLQCEVIELEFFEFSRGMKTISEEDFAHILLRYTNLEKVEIAKCLARVRSRMPEEKGISFEDFKQFCQFMNSLEDFAIAMNMYTIAQIPISQEEFQRAVRICTGKELGSHIVNTVFNIFDEDGDGHLSHKEFISIMKDRKYRGSRSQTQFATHNWESFKSCVKNEMKSY